ncbi:MAG: YigZ family protein [Clostridia bacterium]|nr:YigZ family protein [Clostridia bacterium]
MSDYLTLKCESSDEFTEKRSRFIGYAKPVKTQEEAMDFINKIRSKHWDATHNVYAYILREGQTRRYSDDGEPSGTAGVPVLDVLLKENLTDCVVVATRYFGGIMLGAGGLVRAYSHTSKIAVEAAKIIKMSVCTRLSVTCDYNYYGRLSSLIPEHGGIIEDTDFGENVTVRFYLPSANADIFNAALIDSSFGKFSGVKLGEKYAEIK